MYYGLKKVPQFQSTIFLVSTPPKFNIALEKLQFFKGKVVFQPSIFRGYVSFREGIYVKYIYIP